MGFTEVEDLQISAKDVLAKLDLMDANLVYRLYKQVAIDVRMKLRETNLLPSEEVKEAKRG